MEKIKKYKKYILIGIVCMGLIFVFIPKNSNSDQLVVKGDKNKIEKTEKQKERLVIGMYEPLEHSKIYLGDDKGSILATKLVYESLVRINKDLTIDEQIASKISFSKNGKKATIKLNNKTFSDGSTLNSKAVKASYKALNKSDSDYFNKSYTENIVGMLDYQYGSTKDITGIKVIDDKTLEFDFNDCRSENIYALSLPVINVKNDCGSGDYVIDQFRFQDHLQLKQKNKSGDLSYQKVLIKNVNTVGMEKQMKAYNLDVLEVSKSHFKTIKKIGYHNVYQLNKDDLHYVNFDLSKSSGKNKDLRKAVYYGINKKVLKNDMDDQDVYVGHYLSTTLTDNQDVYNLNKAKKAQSDAHKSKIDFEVSGDVNSLLRYDVLKKTLKKANLELTQGSSFASIQETDSSDKYEIEDKINESYLKKDYQKQIKETYQKNCLNVLKEFDNYILDEYLVLPLYTSTYYLAMSSDVDQEQVIGFMTN